MSYDVTYGLNVKCANSGRGGGVSCAYQNKETRSSTNASCLSFSTKRTHLQELLKISFMRLNACPNLVMAC
jgi:hypothetical protein